MIERSTAPTCKTEDKGLRKPVDIEDNVRLDEDENTVKVKEPRS